MSRSFIGPEKFCDSPKFSTDNFVGPSANLSVDPAGFLNASLVHGTHDATPCPI